MSSACGTMYKPKDIKSAKAQIANIRQKRKETFPYSEDLKRKVLGIAIQELLDDGHLIELSMQFGLEDLQLVRWFRELLSSATDRTSIVEDDRPSEERS